MHELRPKKHIYCSTQIDLIEKNKKSKSHMFVDTLKYEIKLFDQKEAIR